MARIVLRLAVAVGLVALSGAARAQGLDFDLERLRLDPSARGSLVMGDGEVMPGSSLRLSAALHYERRPLVIADDLDLRGRGLFSERSRAADVVGDRTTLHLGAAIGFAGGFEAGFEAPIVLDQSGDGDLGDDRVAAPWLQLRWGSPSPKPITFGIALAASPSWGDGTSFNGNGAWSFLPRLEAGMRLGGSVVMANVGALLRAGDVDLTNGEELGHEALAAIGWATTGRPLRFEVTAHGAFDFDGLGQSAELLAGVRYDLGLVEVYALGGPGFLELPGTPTFRGLVGIALDLGGGGRGAAGDDSDGDGIPDAQDRCPREAGVRAQQGCPPARARIDTGAKKIEIKDKVFFDTGKSTIQERSFALLDDVAALLVANPGAGRVSIEGHTDDVGSPEYNRTLSEERAQAVKAYLVGKGVPAGRLQAKGFGPDRPAVPNTSDEAREANRRVEFVLVP